MYASDVQVAEDKVDIFGLEYAEMASEMKDIRISVEHLFSDAP